ncbi:ABC transporter ATP-binding protein [Lysobacter pythonis]|uniref:ABC transporter ATP-binding protein n=1 Tax=Solilutibacter pythonis TaxID=2483112 RepID=A0A3M2HZ92_9GAMM|nr:ABC transporter ATP-binding protein [Lysobacter pythonis]RMH92970.1 ABC transporter ATP-binding protein [Lysobacter pythonis]
MAQKNLAGTPLDIQALTHRLGNRTVLHDLSLEVGLGELVGLLGPNGAGKTTLLEIIEGIQTPSLGEVRLFGHHPRRLPPAARARIGFIFQRNAIPEHATVAQLIELYRRVHGDSSTLQQTQQRLGLSHLLTRNAGELSIGQRQRVSVFAALAGSPSLVLMDEPTNALDLRSKRAVWDTIIERKREHTLSGLIATHDMEEAEALCDRVVFIEEGHLRGTLSLLAPAEAMPTMLNVDFHAPASFIHSSAAMQSVTVIAADRGDRWRARCPKEQIPGFNAALLEAEREHGFNARLGINPVETESTYLNYVSKAD